MVLETAHDGAGLRLVVGTFINIIVRSIIIYQSAFMIGEIIFVGKRELYKLTAACQNSGISGIISWLLYWEVCFETR